MTDILSVSTYVYFPMLQISERAICNSKLYWCFGRRWGSRQQSRGFKCKQRISSTVSVAYFFFYHRTYLGNNSTNTQHIYAMKKLVINWFGFAAISSPFCAVSFRISLELRILMYFAWSSVKECAAGAVFHNTCSICIWRNIASWIPINLVTKLPLIIIKSSPSSPLTPCEVTYIRVSRYDWKSLITTGL